MGSADLMPRNLNRRVEVVFPVEDQNLVQVIREEILETYLLDNIKARLMQADGTYLRITPEDGNQGINAQSHFLKSRES
jgi:polyphosphate kinase